MSNILFYSKYCESCKKCLTLLSRTEFHKSIHFVCIDRRVKENNKTYIIHDNGERIILPETVVNVPALMLLNEGFQVIYGEHILQYFSRLQKKEVKQATQNNLEPMAYSLGGGSSSVVSDGYSFLDQSSDEMEAKGNGGMRQMHNYMDLNTAFSGQMTGSLKGDDLSGEQTIRGMKKSNDDYSNQYMDDQIKKMKEERDADIRNIMGKQPHPFGI